MVRHSYDTLAKDWANTRNKMQWQEFESMYKVCPLPKDGKVLDLGCGSGRLIDFFDSQGMRPSQYLGVDFSEELIKEAQNAYPNYRFMVQDMRDLSPLAPEKFDHIWCIAALHHLNKSEDQMKAFAQMYQYLDDEGCLFLTVWNCHQPSKKFSKARRQALLRSFFMPWKYSYKDLFFPWRFTWVLRYYYAFRPRELEKRLARAGFALIYREIGKNYAYVLKKQKK